MIEIMKSTGAEFTPHMAVCHMELNGGSANKENIPLVMKASLVGKGVEEVLKSLGEGEDVIKKASYRNTQKMLESAIRESLKPENEEYYYLYLRDFDTTTAVFEYQDKVFSVSYSLNESGIVLLGSDIIEVIRQDVYVSVDGTTLVLKAVEQIDDNETKNPTVDAEGIKKEGIPLSDISHKEKGKNEMTDKVELSIEDLEAKMLKSATDAVMKAKVLWEQDAKVAEITKSTQVIVKGLAFIAEDEAEAIVKALVSLDDEMLCIVKALTSAKDAIATLTAEKDEIVKEFGTKKSTDEKPEGVSDDLAAILKANIAAAKANK